MTRFDLFIVLAAIAMAVVIIRRAIRNAVTMVGNDFRTVFEKFDSVFLVLGTGFGTFRETLDAMAEEKTAVIVDERSEASKPAWTPACSHPTPQYGCPDCIRAARGEELVTPSEPTKN
jgi:hypothetical protein